MFFFNEAGLYLVALFVDAPVYLWVKVVKISVEGLCEAFSDRVERFPDELGNGRQVKRNRIGTLEEIEQDPYFSCG